MKRHALVLALGCVLTCGGTVAALAQRASLLTLSWGPSGVPGLKYHVSCSALGGPSWNYSFENVTDKPITFSYSFGAGNVSHSHHLHSYTIPAHGRWTLRHVAAHYGCNTNGPLQIEPQTNH